MVTLTTVLRSGGRYDPTRVERLARGARQHIAALDRVVCLTDLDQAIGGVETVPLLHDWPTWWSKFEAFRPELADDINILCDLDTLFLSSANILAEENTALVMEDYLLKGRASTALMRWSGSAFSFLYDNFKACPEKWMQPGSCGDVPNSVHGDQVVVDHMFRKNGSLPGFIQHEHSELLQFYDAGKTNTGPILIFIGTSKPDNAAEPVKQAWLQG